MVVILMLSVKLATPGLLKIKVFWNKGYDVIIALHVFWGVVLVESQEFGTYTWYGQEVLKHGSERVQTKYQKMLGAYFYVWISYREKTDGKRWTFCALHPE